MSSNDETIYAEIAAERGSTTHCSACNTSHPLTAFAFKSKAKRQLHSRCRAHQRGLAAASYERNPEPQRANATARRRRQVDAVNALIDEWLDGKTCQAHTARGCTGDTNLIAVGSDGQNLRRRVKDGWGPELIAHQLDDATVNCRPCRNA
jgi:hypothetical protein